MPRFAVAVAVALALGAGSVGHGFKPDVTSVAIGSLVTGVRRVEPTVEIRLAPGDRIYTHDVNRGFGISDVLLQNLAVINRGPDSVQVESIRLELLWRGEVAVSNTITRPMLEALWTRLRTYLTRTNASGSRDATFFLDSLLVGGFRLASGTRLGTNDALILARRPMTVTAILPDSLRVAVDASSPNGSRITAKLAIPVERYHSSNTYVFPVEGRWFIASSAALPSHHRWRPASEFALDLTRVGEGGSTHRASGTRHQDYLAFGQTVVAAADGRVLVARDGVAETALPRPGEARDAFARRVLDSLWRQDPAGRLADGNVVVIAHAGSEYTTYAHLRQGSLKVAVGDSVRSGQPIGAIGLSGDGFEPHLHFQLTAGPDQHFSRGLPIVFENVTPVGMSSTIDSEGRRPLSTGEFVDAKRRSK